VWITFEETPNVNTNPIYNHASGCRTINALEVEAQSLKLLLDKVHKMLIKARYKKGVVIFFG
jgi:hypothetical protein